MPRPEGVLQYVPAVAMSPITPPLSNVPRSIWPRQSVCVMTATPPAQLLKVVLGKFPSSILVFFVKIESWLDCIALLVGLFVPHDEGARRK